MTNLPTISAFDFLVGAGLLGVFLVIFCLAFLAKNLTQIALFFLCALIFLALPFFNILILDNFINKTSWRGDSHKLTYIDSYLLRGVLKNEGRKNIARCEFFLYTKSRYPLKSDFKIVFNALDLRVGGEIALEKIINNFSAETVRDVKIRCF